MQPAVGAKRKFLIALGEENSSAGTSSSATAKKKRGPRKATKRQQKNEQEEAARLGKVGMFARTGKGNADATAPLRQESRNPLSQTWKDHPLLREMDVDYLVQSKNHMKKVPLGEWVKHLDKKKERQDLDDIVRRFEESEESFVKDLYEPHDAPAAAALQVRTQASLPPKQPPKKIDLTLKIRVDPYPTCVVGNTVSTFSIPGAAQNQRKLALAAKDRMPCYFDPKIFAHTQTSIKVEGYPKVKVLGFPSEKVLMAGGKSEEHNRMMAWSYVRFLQKYMGVKEATMKDFRIKNMVANVKAPFWIDLKAIEKTVGGRATFLPLDIHCCRVVSSKNATMVVLYFTGGSILMTGFKGEEQLRDIYLESCELAYSHKLTERKRKQIMDKYQKKKKSSSLQTVVETNRELVEMDKEEARNVKKERNKKKRELRQEILGIKQKERIYLHLLNEGEEEYHERLKLAIEDGRLSADDPNLQQASPTPMIASPEDTELATFRPYSSPSRLLTSPPNRLLLTATEGTVGNALMLLDQKTKASVDVKRLPMTSVIA